MYGRFANRPYIRRIIIHHRRRRGTREFTLIKIFLQYFSQESAVRKAFEKLRFEFARGAFHRHKAGAVIFAEIMNEFFDTSLGIRDRVGVLDEEYDGFGPRTACRVPRMIRVYPGPRVADRGSRIINLLNLSDLFRNQNMGEVGRNGCDRM